MITVEYLKTWHDRKARKYLYFISEGGDFRYFSPAACELYAEKKISHSSKHMSEIVGVRAMGTGDIIRLACLYKTKKAAENSLKSGARECKNKPVIPTADDFMATMKGILDDGD